MTGTARTLGRIPISSRSRAVHFDLIADTSSVPDEQRSSAMVHDHWLVNCVESHPSRARMRHPRYMSQLACLGLGVATRHPFGCTIQKRNHLFDPECTRCKCAIGGRRGLRDVISRDSSLTSKKVYVLCDWSRILAICVKYATDRPVIWGCCSSKPRKCVLSPELQPTQQCLLISDAGQESPFSQGLILGAARLAQ